MIFGRRESRASEVPDSGDGRSHDVLALQRRATKRHAVFMAAVLGSVLVATPLGAFLFARNTDLRGRISPAEWLLILGVPVGFVLVVFGSLYWLQTRRRVSWLPGPGPLLGADRDTRRRVARALRGGHLPDREPDRALALDAAERMVAVRWVPIALFVLSALLAFNALLTSSTVLRWLFATNVVLLAGSGLLQLVMRRKARRLLATGR